MTEYVSVQGLAELRTALLKTVPQHFQGPILQKALLAGAKPIVADAQIRAPVRSGVLERAIYSYADRAGSHPGFESRLIGVRHGGKAQKSNSDAYYWRFIEFGRGEVVAKHGKVLGNPDHGFFGKTVRAYPSHPFLRPAFESAKEQALQEITKALTVELQVAAQKASWGTKSNFAIGQSGGANLASAAGAVFGQVSSLGGFLK